MESSSTDFHINGLQDDTPLLGPKLLQTENQLLKIFRGPDSFSHYSISMVVYSFVTTNYKPARLE